MADNDTKQEFQYLDIPDGQGGADRWWCEDAEARAAIEELEPPTYASEQTCEDIISELI